MTITNHNKNEPPELRQFNPSGWHYEDDGLLDDISGPRLSDVEVAHLLSGEAIENPAEMNSYEDIDKFTHEENNFHTIFNGAPGEMYWSLKHRLPVFQRYELLYPKETDEICAQVQSKNFQEFSVSDWRLLHTVYQRMAKLVSRNDPSVIKDGEVDKSYLCR